MNKGPLTSLSLALLLTLSLSCSTQERRGKARLREALTPPPRGRDLGSFEGRGKALLKWWAWAHSHRLFTKTDPRSKAAEALIRAKARDKDD